MLLATLGVSGCHPATPAAVTAGRPATALTVALPPGSTAGVGGDGELIFVARSASTGDVVEGRRGPTVAWQATLDGRAGALGAGADRLAVAVTLSPDGGERAAIVALDPRSGHALATTALRATEALTITAVVPIVDGVVIGGSFGGTLRVGARVVSSAGSVDGFVARLTADGHAAWLRRVGGPGADAVQGVAVRGDAVAVAGTFSVGAELAGDPLPSFDEHLASADGFVAVLDPSGTPRWSATFGGQAEDAVAGVALDGHGQLVVTGTARGVVHVGPHELTVRGTADALVAWWSPTGEAGPAVLLGGDDFDGASAIVALDRGGVAVAGYYSGSLDLGARHLVAGGGDDAFAAALDEHGAVVAGWSLGGEGREEVTGLGAVPGGFVVAVAHTAAASLAGGSVAAPADPMAGAALVVIPAP